MDSNHCFSDVGNSNKGNS